MSARQHYKKSDQSKKALEKKALQLLKQEKEAKLIILQELSEKMVQFKIDKSQDSLKVIEKINDLLIDEGADLLYDHYLESKKRNFMLQKLFGEISTQIKISFIQCEHRKDDKYLDAETAEIEPQSAQLDSCQAITETKQRIVVQKTLKENLKQFSSLRHTMKKIQSNLSSVSKMTSLMKNDSKKSNSSNQGSPETSTYNMNKRKSKIEDTQNWNMQSSSSNFHGRTREKRDLYGNLTSKKPKIVPILDRTKVNEDLMTEEELQVEKEADKQRKLIKQRDIIKQFQEEERLAVEAALNKNSKLDGKNKNKIKDNDRVTTDFRGKMIKVKQFKPAIKHLNQPTFKTFENAEMYMGSQQDESELADPFERRLPIKSHNNVNKALKLDSKDPREAYQAKKEQMNKKMKQIIKQLNSKSDSASGSLIAGIANNFKKGKKNAQVQQTVENEPCVQLEHHKTEGVRYRHHQQDQIQKRNFSLTNVNDSQASLKDLRESGSQPMLQLLKYHKRRASEALDYSSQKEYIERRRFDGETSDILHIGDGEVSSIVEFDSNVSPKPNKAKKNWRYHSNLGKIKIQNMDAAIGMLSESKEYLAENNPYQTNNQYLRVSNLNIAEDKHLSRKNHSVSMSYSMLPELKGLLPQDNFNNINSGTQKVSGLSRIRSDLRRSVDVNAQNIGSGLVGIQSHKNLSGISRLQANASSNLLEQKKAFYRDPLKASLKENSKYEGRNSNLQLNSGVSEYNSVPVSALNSGYQKVIPSKGDRSMKNLRYIQSMK